MLDNVDHAGIRAIVREEIAAHEMQRQQMTPCCRCKVPGGISPPPGTEFLTARDMARRS